MRSLDDLIPLFDAPDIDKEPALDVLRVAPELTYDDAYRLQFAIKQKRVKAGDSIAGYQASFTSAGAQKMVPTMPVPMVGTLLRSLIRNDGATVELDSDFVVIESEIGVVMKRDLAGPNVSPLDALAAIEGFFPAIEVAPVRPGVLEGKWSNQHLIAVQKAVGGYVVLGSTITSPRDIDIRLEGVVVSFDNKVRGSAAGVEAMGSPLHVIAAVANKLALYGHQLKAGQILITGSVPSPQRILPADQFSRV
jgi:2-keto-4-pentenoate hydratase